MKKDIKSVLLFLFSFGGLLFASYIGGVKFFTGACSFNESCPYFLGYPACYYGFVMYLLLSIFAYLLLTSRMMVSSGVKVMMTVSGLGILFAGYFTLRELPLLFTKGLAAYTLVLPTCAYGLIFYVLIFTLSKLISNTNKI